MNRDAVLVETLRLVAVVEIVGSSRRLMGSVLVEMPKRSPMGRMSVGLSA